MVLTLVIGEVGAGKTSFLDETANAHKCIYVRQNHTLLPTIPVVEIPNFDPTMLPFWKTYESAGTTLTVKVGDGTIPVGSSGEAGVLSSEERKILLFEFLCQHVIHQPSLSLVLDEPFAGVPNNYVQFILLRLHVLRQRHNILLSTNDHVNVLQIMADDVIVVSRDDHATVKVNGLSHVSRDNAILALVMSGLLR